MGFFNYTYNTAEGGGFGTTIVQNNINTGAAWLKPFGGRGELGVDFAWLDAIRSRVRGQYNLENYWKILLTPDLWVTPGVQFLFAPALNPNEDLVVVRSARFRLFF